MALAPPDDGDTVRVAARVRPLLPREKVANCCNCITVDKGRQVVVGTRRTFAFDVAFDTEATQSEVYEACAASLLSGCLQGYNATILAYGQTGSGKTHTMGTGQAHMPEETEEEGITPKIIKNSFLQMEALREELEFKVSCCYIELYNEEIRDLMQPSGQKTAVTVRETAGGVIQLAGIHAEPCSSAEEMLRCLGDGSTQRTTAATLMNEQSSRSHSIFTIIFEQRKRCNQEQRRAWASADESGGEAVSTLSYRTAKFHLVDLAGSERQKRTGAVGSRFKESVAINSGLLALGNVISALGDVAKRGCHVPYRESKLTRLLQDSLGGNSRTWMVACASCADSDFEETLNTLKYAHRARNIKNKPVVNHDPRVAQLAAMQDEIEALRSELRRVHMSPAASSTPLPQHGNENGNEVPAELNDKLEDAEQRNHELVDRLVGVEAGAETLRLTLADLYSTSCECTTWLLQNTGVASEARLAAKNALCRSLQSAKRVLSEVGGNADALPDAPKLEDTEVDEQLDPREIAEAIAESSEPGFAGGESSRLESLAEMRKDAAPLLRKYLDDIKRLEAELMLYKRRTKELQQEVSLAKDDLQKDEEIFQEKMLEMKALADRNEILSAQLQEAAQCSERRPSLRVPAPSYPSNACTEPRSLAAQLEDFDEVRTEDPEEECVVGGSIEDHVDEAVQTQLDESLAAQRLIEQEMKHLAQNLDMKKELISELVRSEREWGATKAQYQKVVEQMQAELEHMQRELALFQAQDHTAEEKCILEERIADQTDCIRTKQQEFRRLRELRQQDSKKIRDIEAETGQLQSNQRELDRRLQVERKRSARLQDLKEQQPDHLHQRSHKAENPRYRDSSKENRSNTVKEQGSRGGSPRPSRKNSYSSIASRGSAVPNVRNSVDGSVNCASTPGSSRAQRLEQQIDNHIRRHEASQGLDEDLRKRDGLLKKREQYGNYRMKIAAKDAIEQQELRDGLVQIDGRITELEKELASTTADSEAASDLHRQKDALSAEYEQLSSSGQRKHAEGLSVLHDVDERLECLQDEIDFREARIAKAQQMLYAGSSASSLSSGIGSLDAELAGVPAEDAKELLRRYCEKIVRYRQREKHTGKRVNALEAQLSERSRQVAELKEVLRKQDVNSTKNVSKVTKEYESRIRLLLRQLSSAQQGKLEESRPDEGMIDGGSGKLQAPGDPQPGHSSNLAARLDGNDVEKLQNENKYYKAVNRELKRRLRNLLERGEGSAGEGSIAAGEDSGGKPQNELGVHLRRVQKEKAALGEENSRIRTQLQNLKQYYAKFHDIPASPGDRPQPGAPGPIPSDAVQSQLHA